MDARLQNGGGGAEAVETVIGMPPDVPEELYEHTTSLISTSLDVEKSKEAVWVSSAHPSPISLKLQVIQKTVKANGRMDSDCLNLAIRRMEREKSNDCKHYVSADFARYAISEEDRHSNLEACIHNEFFDRHNASNSEVLFIPVLHYGHWTLYSFNMNDDKLTILGHKLNRKHPEDIRLKVCKALELVKTKFNLIESKSDDFSSWTYEFAELPQLNNSCSNNCGFLVFNCMRHWDGHGLIDQQLILTESKRLRKDFLAYILSFKDNEAYDLPRRVSQLIKKLPAGPAWTRCSLDDGWLKIVREGTVGEFRRLCGPKREKIIRGVTSDGDGVLHIASRLGHADLVSHLMQRDVHSAGFLRARNNKGETCLHEAVRQGHTKIVKTLISSDRLVQMLISSDDRLVQIMDYEGVSPLYLATILRRTDIARILRDEEYTSYAGPGGKTALHAAVLLNKEFSEELLKWKPELNGKADNSGNTPLHLLASVGGSAVAELLQEGEHDAVVKKDSKGWLPIHVAAANGRLDIVRQLLEARRSCMLSRNSSGQSFLHVAVDKRSVAVVRYVCKQENLAEILNMRDRDGNTALHLAVKSGNQIMFCSLMGNKGVHLSFTNKEGRTPLDIAILSIEPGLVLLMNARVLIYIHLKLAGAYSGICRRDKLTAVMAGKLDKEKLSKTISKFAGLMAVGAIFMLNISVTAFFSVAKQNLSPSDPNAAPPPTAQAVNKSDRARAHAFNALVVSDAITFASSALAAICTTFAGFSVMDRLRRFAYLRIGVLSLQIACIAVVVVFVSAAYLTFAPLDSRLVTVTSVLPLLAITPQLVIPYIFILFHAWTYFHRFILFDTKVFFKKHVFPKIHAILKNLQTFCSRLIPAFIKKAFASIIAVVVCMLQCCWLVASRALDVVRLLPLLLWVIPVLIIVYLVDRWP